MAKPQQPELRKFLEKKLSVKVNGSRTVLGFLRGFDHYTNLTLGDAVEVVSASEHVPLGTIIVRGSAVVQIECLDRA